jgi:uroporphyrinogen decarboxylase
LQFEGGAEVVMIFDTAAGEVSHSFFQAHLQDVLGLICQDFPNKLGYYSKGTQEVFFNSAFKSLPWAGQGFDHRNHLPDCFKVQNKGFVQGNFDQSLLFLESDDFKKNLRFYLQTFKDLSPEQKAGWVCGLGHGVLPKTPEKNVHNFVEIVRKEFSK